MKKYDITLLTESRYENPKNKNWYIKNIIKEDYLVQKYLEDLGLNVIRKDWNNSEFKWEETKYALFRTTWDYFDKFKKFKSWLKNTKNKTEFINSYEQIMWNTNKHYLLELSKKNIKIPPTKIITKNTKIDLKEVFTQSNFKEIIIKPTVSGAGRHTYRVNKSNIDNYKNIFSLLIKEEDFIVQEFQKNILTKGEISIMLINGKHTHAILKKAKKNEFRVQDDFGGTVHSYSASKEEIKFAENIISVIKPKPVYARVDLMFNDKNEIVLSELELIEPEMWFRKNPLAAEILAKKIFEIYF